VVLRPLLRRTSVSVGCRAPPITRNQVELMQIDSVSMPELPGLEALGIRPHSVEELLQEILKTH
jgi:hypothetical protein